MTGPAGAPREGAPREGAPLEGAHCVVAYDCLFPWTIGGAERWYRSLAEQLVSSGARVTYLTRVQWDGDPPAIPGVDVVAVQQRCELYLPDGTRKTGPPLRFGAGVFSWLARHRGDVDSVHVANFPYFSLLGARLALLGTATPLVADWFEVWPATFWRRYAGTVAGTVGAAVQEVCLAASPHALVFWEHTARRIRAHRLHGELTVLPGLLPSREVNPAAQLGTPARPVALFAGRHVKDKGVRQLAEALRVARCDVPSLEMVIAGEGPETDLIESELTRLGVREAAALTGKVSDDELERLVAHASCVLVASVREGYGLMAVEAAALGTPAVVAAHPENAAVGHVVDGVNGFVVEPTASGLARGIVRCVEGGAALRASTAQWYAAHAPSMSMASSARAVVELYRRLGVAGR